jgi:hypothetical protein
LLVIRATAPYTEEWRLAAFGQKRPFAMIMKLRDMDDADTKLIAHALYQIRVILGAYIGTATDAPADVRLAANLAYALHNEALALAEGTRFDVNSALQKVAAIDSILNTDEGTQFVAFWNAKINTMS